MQALRAGKAETDDFVERATVAHISGYYVTTEKATREGKVTVREWVKGDPNAGLKWLGCRRPDQYRKQEVKTRELGGGFLAALEAMNERAKLPERSRLVNGPKLIEQKPDPGHQDGGQEQG